MKMPGRNEPCPCGSGKKYKKCCLLDSDRNYDLRRAMQLADNPDGIKKILSEKLKKYVFKVYLLQMALTKINKEISRTLEISEKATLYDLHLLIQNAFNWDNDHMFSFFLGKDMNDKENEYSADPFGEHHISNFGQPTKSASNAEIRDLNLQLDQEFIYLFDYGDRLLHRIIVQDISESDDFKKNTGKIISKVGNTP